jgi:uncharacterized membrane protein YkoI
MKPLNKFLMAFMSIAVIFGGYAMLQTSHNPTEADAESVQTSNKSKVDADVDELGDVDDVDDSDVDDIEESTEADDETPMAPQPGTISEVQAVSIAEATYKGDGKKTQVELEMENGILVYAIEFTEKDGNEVDVKINAKTGAVVLVESDKTDTEDDD